VPANVEAAQQLAADLAAAEARPRKIRTAQEPTGAPSARASRAEARTAAAEAPAAAAEQAADEPARRPAKATTTASTASAAPASDLPAQPSRDDVRAALDAVIPELQKCAGSLHGTADVTMTVRSGGVVSYAVVAGTFAGTPEGSCIARTVKLAKFPAFSDPSVRVSYPFEL
jgi:outer membrane biosynthesis protein TonB